MRYDAHCKKCGGLEIEKAMNAPMPRCPKCGGELRRVYGNPTVLYKASGFYSTDFAHFEKQVGTEKAAKFRSQKDDAESRAKAGKLTPYERALEAV